MVLDGPFVKAEQHSSVRVEELTKVRVRRSRRGLAEQWLVPLEATRHIMHPDDRPRAFHSVLLRSNDPKLSDSGPEAARGSTPARGEGAGCAGAFAAGAQPVTEPVGSQPTPRN